MEKNETSLPIELSTDIQKLFDNYIVKKICANTKDQLSPISETGEQLTTKLADVLNRTSDLLSVTDDTNLTLKDLLTDLPEAIEDIPRATDKQVTGKLKTINNNVIEKAGGIIQKFEDKDVEWQTRYSALMTQIDSAHQETRCGLVKKLDTLSADERADRIEQYAKILARLDDAAASVNDSQTAQDNLLKKNAEMLLKTINERSLQITEKCDTNLGVLQTSLEKHTYSINENLQRIGAEIQAVQADGTERMLSAISETSVVVNKIAKQQEEHHQQLIGQLQEMETINEQWMDEVVSRYQKENTYLKKIMYISWAIGGTTLAATIASILIQLL